MATSGTNTYNPVRDTIIKDALRMCGAYATGNSPSTDDMADGLEALNSLLKSWQLINGLWLKSFITIPLNTSSQSYSIPDGTDTTYRPTRVFSGVIRDSSNNDIPLNIISRTDYENFSSKSSTGKVSSVYYDPQLSTGKLYVWPVSSVSTDSLVLTVDRPIYDVVADTETVDLPQEWIECLKHGLAWRLSKSYGLPKNERDEFKADYLLMRQELINYNTENDASTFIQPDLGA